MQEQADRTQQHIDDLFEKIVNGQLQDPGLHDYLNERRTVRSQNSAPASPSAGNPWPPIGYHAVTTTGSSNATGGVLPPATTTGKITYAAPPASATKKRVAAVSLGVDALLALLQGKIEFAPGQFPDDMRVVMAAFEPYTKTLEILVQSDTFAELDEGVLPPILSVLLMVRGHDEKSEPTTPEREMTADDIWQLVHCDF